MRLRAIQNGFWDSMLAHVGDMLAPDGLKLAPKMPLGGLRAVKNHFQALIMIFDRPRACSGDFPRVSL